MGQLVELAGDQVHQGACRRVWDTPAVLLSAPAIPPESDSVGLAAGLPDMLKPEPEPGSL